MSRTVRPEVGAELAHEVGQLAGLLGIHPGGRLVEQEELGFGRQRPGDLEAPLIAVRQVPGQLLGPLLEADQVQQLHGPVVRLLLLAKDRRRPDDRRPTSDP